MPIYSDPYDSGTGGGTTSTVCQISPSDNIAVLSNYGNRLADIEKFLSRLVGADVHADNLADLAANMGNLLNGSLMMPYSPNNSWAGVGGSIAVPDGFTGTFVSGNVTTIWNDGVVTFEATPHGIVVGGGATDFLILEPASTSLSGSGLNATADLSTVIWSGGSAFSTGNLSTSTIDITEAGWYHISVVMLTGIRATAGSTWMEVLVRDETDTTVKSVQDLYGQHAAPNNQNQTLKVSFTFKALIGYDVKILFNNTTGSLFSITSCIVSIEKLAGV